MQKKIANKDDFIKLKIELDTTKEQSETTGKFIKELKEKNTDKQVLEPHIKKLKELNEKVKTLQEDWQNSDPNKLHINRFEFEELMTRRFFYIPSFEIYGGVGGLYDYGPSCCSIKSNLIQLWRKHFIIEENMLELDLSNLTPEKVFITSGHVAKFADFMVQDTVTHDCFRADKLILEFIEEKVKDVKLSPEEVTKLKSIELEIDSYTEKDLDDCIKKLEIKSPEKKNPLSAPYPFNLMFSTQIGPTGKAQGYLRPETAQGIFVNFKRLYNYNGGNMPFAGATVGCAFRNEISPRSGLLRVREFTLAEIEHFCNPKDKRHPKFKNIKNIVVPFFTRERQKKKEGTIDLSIGEALDRGYLNNETHAYFLGRTYLFMLEAGILKNGIRFRQHLDKEMAHYATDCWDCELLTSYGWIECVGIADRSCYDLTKHSEATKSDLTAFEPYKEPILVDVIEFSENKGAIGKVYKAKAKDIVEHLKSLPEDQMTKIQNELNKNKKTTVIVKNEKFEITEDMCEFKKVQKKEGGRTYVPAVIEPAFGIGRIIYSLLEHAYWTRTGDVKEEKKEDKKEVDKSKLKQLERTVLSLSPSIAPYKAVILPLQNEEKFYDFITKISSNLSNHGISYRVDDSGAAIGRRYARNDEIGIPFAITVDFDSLKDDTITLRERDSCFQIRAPQKEVVEIIKALIEKRMNWNDVMKKYPTQLQTASDKVGFKE